MNFNSWWYTYYVLFRLKPIFFVYRYFNFFFTKWHSNFFTHQSILKWFMILFDIYLIGKNECNWTVRCIWRHNFSHIINNIIILTSCTNLWHNSVNRLPNYIKFHMLEILRNCYSKLKLLLFYVKNWRLIPI